MAVNFSFQSSFSESQLARTILTVKYLEQVQSINRILKESPKNLKELKLKTSKRISTGLLNAGERKTILQSISKLRGFSKNMISDSSTRF